MLKLLSWECLLGSATSVSVVNGPREPGSGPGKPPGSHLKKRKREKKMYDNNGTKDGRGEWKCTVGRFLRYT